MIRSFACADTEVLFHSRAVSRFRDIERVARRKLLQIHAATELASLRIPPGNQIESSIVNSSTVKLNADGTFTVHFGSVETCGNVPNRLDTTEGWNFLMRIYRPGKSVLEGAYELPAAKPVK
jgi:plasmid maintenance system killer protein